MSKVDTLIKKLCQKPTPADFRYSDLRKIMAYFGYVESNKDLLIKVKPQNKKIRQPSAAHDKQHSNAGQNTARATEGIAKQAQPSLAKSG